MKIILSTRAVLIFSVFFLFACSEVDDKQSVTTAKKYIESNQLRAATLELKNALKANPKNAEARFLLGGVNLTVGDMASAVKEFQRAQEAGWDEAQSQIGRMNALVYLRDFETILDDIQIKESYSLNARADLYGLKAFAEAASGYAGLAKVSIKQGEALDKDAFQFLKTSIQLNITGAEPGVAAVQIKHALSLYVNNTDLLLLSAYLAMQGKENMEARVSLQKIISLEPKSLVTFNGRKARLGLARLEMRDKKMDQVKSLLAPLFKQNTNDPEANYLGAVLSFERADFDLAEERLLKVLNVAPGHAKSQLLFGTVNFAQKDYEQAAYYIGKYLQLEPGDVGARKLLGRTYILMGQHEEATAILQPGLQGGNDDAELLALVGLSQLQGGDFASGINELKKAVAADPESDVFRGELVKAYISAGETENAIRALKAILAEGGDKQQAKTLLVLAHIKAEQYDQAIVVVLDMLHENPKDIVVLTLAGNVFAASSDRAEARKYFKQVLSIEPENIQAGMQLARMEELEGDVEQATILYQQLSKNDSKSIDPLLALARLAKQGKDDKKMIYWLESATDKAPLDIRPKIALAEYYLQENQLDKVKVLVEAGLNISSNNLSMLLLKGRLLVAQKRFSEALSPLNELITRSPKSVYTRSILAEAYLKLGQLNDARRQLTIVLQQEPYYLPALLVFSRVEQSSGNYGQALKYAEKAQKVEPDSYMSYEFAGDALIVKRDFAEAKASYEKAWQRKPSAELAIKLSEVSVRSGKPEEAVRPLLTWLSDFPDDPRALQFLGVVYQNLKQNDKAVETFEKVLTIQPDNVVVLNNLAWLYSLANNPKALGLAERAYQLTPDVSGVQDTYGWLLVQQDQADKGRRILEQVIKVFPDVPEIQYHYAVALMKTGEKLKGRKILIKLLESGKPFEGIIDAQALLN